MRNGGERREGDRLRRGRRDDGSPLARRIRGAGTRLPLGMATFHPTLPRGARVRTTQNATLEEILTGPANENDGTLNLLRRVAHLDGHLRLRGHRRVQRAS